MPAEAADSGTAAASGSCRSGPCTASKEGLQDGWAEVHSTSLQLQVGTLHTTAGDEWHVDLPLSAWQ